METLTPSETSLVTPVLLWHRMVTSEDGRLLKSEEESRKPLKFNCVSREECLLGAKQG